MKWAATVAFVVAVLAGCDKAASGFEQCQQLRDKGDLEGAIVACTASVAADQESESGKAAAAVLPVLQADLIKKKAEEARIAALKKAEAEMSARLSKITTAWRIVDFAGTNVGLGDRCVAAGHGQYVYGCTAKTPTDDDDWSDDGQSKCARDARRYGCPLLMGRLYCCSQKPKFD